MQWQLGGNFEPVRLFCEIDWKECSKAIANYVWSEIVTDVIDCLTNETWLAWRVLCIVIITTVVAHKIYRKIRSMYKSNLDKEILNKVGCKVQDLELKVNILTYKIQYGTWPLPHQIRSSRIKKDLCDIRLTLSNPDDRSIWIKHMLLNPCKSPYFSWQTMKSYNGRKFERRFHAKEADSFNKRSLDYFSPSCTNSEKSIKCFNRNEKHYEKMMKRQNGTESKERHTSKSENSVLRERRFRPISSVPRKPDFVQSNKSQRRCKYSSCANSVPCKKFLRTMDECKRFLRELKSSNKSLGLICSSSDFSDYSLSADVSATESSSCFRPVKTLRRKCDKRKSEKTVETTKSLSAKAVRNNNDKKQKSKDHEYFSKEVPSLKNIKKQLPALNLTFHSDTFSTRQTKEPNNFLIPDLSRRDQFEYTSQESLHQVREKLENLHEILDTYNAHSYKNFPGNIYGKMQSKNEIADGKKSKVTFIIKAKDSEDDSSRNSCVSVRFTDVPLQSERSNHKRFRGKDFEEKANSQMIDYPINFSKYTINDFEKRELEESDRSSYVSCDVYLENDESERYQDSEIINSQMALITTNNVIYFLANSVPDLETHEPVIHDVTSEDNITEPKITEIKTCDNNPIYDGNKIEVNKNETKENQFNFCSNQTSVHSSADINSKRSLTNEMEDNDFIDSKIFNRMSSNSSDSSNQVDTSTAMLLEEALLFKTALLTHVESSRMYHDELEKQYDEEIEFQSTFKPKSLDIITEEHLSNTFNDETDQTYLFLLNEDKIGNNLKENFEANSTCIENEIKEETKDVYYSSYQIPESMSSEYFSFPNLMLSKSNEINDIPLIYLREIRKNIEDNFSSTDNIQKIDNEESLESMESTKVRNDMRIESCRNSLTRSEDTFRIKSTEKDKKLSCVEEEPKMTPSALQYHITSENKKCYSLKRHPGIFSIPEPFSETDKNVDSMNNTNLNNAHVHTNEIMDTNLKSITKSNKESVTKTDLENECGVLKNKTHIKFEESIVDTNSRNNSVSVNSKPDALEEVHHCIPRVSLVTESTTDSESKEVKEQHVVFADNSKKDKDLHLSSKISTTTINRGSNISLKENSSSNSRTSLKCKRRERLSPRIKKLQEAIQSRDSNVNLSESNNRLKVKENVHTQNNPGDNLETPDKINCSNVKSNDNLSFTKSQSFVEKTSSKYKTNLETNITEMGVENQTKDVSKTKVQSTVLPKISSKSCIPVLKTRLDAARQLERPRSPARSPLTMTMLWKVDPSSNRTLSDSTIREEYVKEVDKCKEKLVGDNSEYRKEEITDEEYLEKLSYVTKPISSLTINENIRSLTDIDQFRERTVEDLEKEMTEASIMKPIVPKQNSYQILPKDQVTMYVDIVTDQDHDIIRILNPESFLDYLKNNELKIRRVVTDESKSLFNEKDTYSTLEDQENNEISRVLSIISQINLNVKEEVESDEKDENTVALQTDEIPLDMNKLLNMLNKFSLVEKKEVEITAKPSIMDSSTSISDLQENPENKTKKIDKFHSNVPKNVIKEKCRSEILREG